jgi:hypothetical protein
MGKKERKNQRRKSVALWQSNYKNGAATGETAFLYGDYKHSIHQVTVLIMLAGGYRYCSSACLSDIFLNESRVICEWNSVQIASAIFLQTVEWDRPCVGSEAKVMFQ